MVSNTASPRLYACALCAHKLYYKNVITVFNLYSIISTAQNLLITMLVTNILNKNCLVLAQFYARSHCQNGFSQHVNQYL
jgi:hypothetical protein